MLEVLKVMYSWLKQNYENSLIEGLYPAFVSLDIDFIDTYMPGTLFYHCPLRLAKEIVGR